MDEKDKIIGEAGWNLSESDIFLIASLRRDALTLYSEGKIEKSFFKWKSIKFVISGRFTEEERKNLREKESEIFKKSFTKKGDEEERVILDRSVFAMLLEVYIDELNKLMRKYKLDIADREKKIKLS